MSGQPPARCDDPSTWRHRYLIHLPDLLRLIEENRGPVNLDLHEACLLHVDARPEALQAHADAYALQHRSGKKPPWLWAPAERGVNLTGAHLEYAYLEGAHLEHARLWQAQLQNADLGLAHLEHARFWGANLQHAYLCFAHLEHAGLWAADLRGAFLYAASLERTGLRREQLGAAIGDELAAKGRARHGGTFQSAREAYMALKVNFDAIGRYDDASWAYVKEQQMEKAMYFPTTAGHRWIRRGIWRGHRRYLRGESGMVALLARRRILGRLQWAWLHLRLFLGLCPGTVKKTTGTWYGQGRDRDETLSRWRWARNWAYELLTGYGERVYMPLIWAAVVIAVFTAIYAGAGNVASGNGGATHDLVTALTHSIATFATVGFNTLEPVGWGARLLTAIEAMFGIGLFALFVFTLGNRMRRS